MFDYYAMKVNHLAMAVLLVSAVIGWYRARRWPAAIQLFGAASLGIGVVIGYLMPLQPEPNTHRLDLGTSWRAQVLLSSGGLLIFAIGYAVERLRGRKT